VQVLKIENLSHAFGPLKVLEDVYLDLEDNTITAIIGPNGSGKSTLFNLISGTLRPQGGNILFNGINIAGFKPYVIARRGLSRTFQDPQPLCGMTVLENVKTASLLNGTASKESLLRILVQCSLENEADTDAAGLSFAKLRFLELARVMAMKPKLLLVDEPFSGLNTSEIERMSNLLLRMRDEFGTSTLISGHLVGHLAKVAKEFVALHRGKVIAKGSFDEVRNNPAVIETYLGESNVEN